MLSTGTLDNHVIDGHPVEFHFHSRALFCCKVFTVHKIDVIPSHDQQHKLSSSTLVSVPVHFIVTTSYIYIYIYILLRVQVSSALLSQMNGHRNLKFHFNFHGYCLLLMTATQVAGTTPVHNVDVPN